jgi:hypothetical protein
MACVSVHARFDVSASSSDVSVSILHLIYNFAVPSLFLFFYTLLFLILQDQQDPFFVCQSKGKK